MSDQNQSDAMVEEQVLETAEEQESQEQPQEEASDVSKVELENFNEQEHQNSKRSRLDLIMDIVLPVSIELGRTSMYVKNVLELERGSIIELDKMAGEPADLYINNKKMAEGEVVVVDKHFGIRITQLIDPEDRIKNLGKSF